MSDQDSAARALKFVVIGAGMAGILSVIELRRAGYDDITVYEKAESFGGTWRENTYPGLACDVPSHLYSYSFAPNPDWTHTFSDGGEIRAYFERVAHDHDVARDVVFGDAVVACTFANGRWEIETAAAIRDTADVVIAATGVLHHPKLPDLDGLDSFAGAAFHSARWDHSVPLDGARIGVVGTGSTAVQITAALVERARRTSPCSSARRSGCCRRRTRPTRRRSGRSTRRIRSCSARCTTTSPRRSARSPPR